MNNNHSRTSIFLMELIIAFLCFSLTSAVCVQLFVETHLQDKETAGLNIAIVETQSAMEVMRSFDYVDYKSCCEEVMQTLQAQDGECYYDANGKRVNKLADANYMMRCELSDEGQFVRCHATFFETETDKEIYALQLKIYKR